MTSAGATQKSEAQAIREVVDRWLTASKQGDLDTVLSLQADDIIFMVPGKEPFGKKEFAENFRRMGAKIDAVSDIKEIRVLGDWAWLRNKLEVTITPTSGEPVKKSGYVLTILTKTTDGSWVIARDANLLT